MNLAAAEPMPRLPHLNEHLLFTIGRARGFVAGWFEDYNTERPHIEFTNRPRLGHNETEAKLSAA